MLLLTIYIFIALGFSFICSIAEAVLLSVTTGYISLLEVDGKKVGKTWRHLKDDIDKPLSAILTLNTIAHTAGAAGAGAQATVVFGSAALGIFSAVLTLLILVFSEIIPKTLGATYWRELAPVTANVLRWLVIALYPFVLMSKKLTGSLSHDNTLTGFSRDEFAALAEQGGKEGQLEGSETRILRNLLLLRDMPVKEVMTPRPVIFSLEQNSLVSEFCEQHHAEPFSRIPVYEQTPDNVIGFVLRSDLMLAQVNGEGDQVLKKYLRELPALSEVTTLMSAFELLAEQRSHLALIVNEYGVVVGLVTLEDIFETLVGIEITDEVDKTTDLQQLARRFGRRRARSYGLDEDSTQTD